MSLACQSIKNDDDEQKSTSQIAKDIYEDEELDYEEEVEPVKSSDNLKCENDDDEDGELIEDDDDAGEIDDVDASEEKSNTVRKKDKDEGN